MRELAIRLRFTRHCLGNAKKQLNKDGKRRNVFVFLRSPSGKVVFMPTWWRSILLAAAKVHCRHHSLVGKVMFSPEIDGNPRPIPNQIFRRYSGPRQFSCHEAFFPGDEIGATALVPTELSDSDFETMLNLAGRYCGISPARSGEFGFFTVESVRKLEPLALSESPDLVDCELVTEK